MVFGFIPECRSDSFRNRRSPSSESPPGEAEPSQSCCSDCENLFSSLPADTYVLVNLYPSAGAATVRADDHHVCAQKTNRKTLAALEELSRSDGFVPQKNDRAVSSPDTRRANSKLASFLKKTTAPSLPRTQGGRTANWLRSSNFQSRTGFLTHRGFVPQKRNARPPRHEAGEQQAGFVPQIFRLALKLAGFVPQILPATSFETSPQYPRKRLFRGENGC